VSGEVGHSEESAARFSALGEEGPGDQDIAGAVAGALGLGSEGILKVLRVEMDLAGGDLVRSGAVETKFANAEAAIDAEGRAEDAAGHGTGGIEVAEASGGIESGTWLVVGKVLELFGAGFVEETGERVPGKIGGETRDGCCGTAADSCGARRIGGGERGKSFAETGSIELRNGKDSNAALVATRSAEQPGAGAASGVGDSGIDDLDKLRVSDRNHGFRIAKADRP
jgi:hypothetical protein